MMERHNRKSYLAPPAPKSLKESKDIPSPGQPKAPSPVHAQKQVSNKSSRSAAGEVPFNVDHGSSQQRQHVPSNPSYFPSRSNRSPPISLEHLSLESRQDENRSARRPSRTPLGDTSSTTDQSLRPSLGSHSASSHNTNSRMPLQSTALPFRAAPTPAAPNSGGWSRRGDHMKGAV